MFLISCGPRYVWVKMKEEPQIRVLLAEAISKVEVGSTGNFEIITKNGYKRLDKEEKVVVYPGPKVLINYKYEISSPKYPILFSPSGNSIITVNGVPYRGKILIKGNSKTFKIINIVGIEEYLFGVLPAEVGKITPSRYEAAKAQAVAARSYALARLGKRPDFDVYADTRDQVYKGYESETEEARRAVLETRGEVLTFRDEIVEAKYHSTCGGKTASSEDIWGVKKPYFTSIKDRKFFGKPFCSKSPHFEWEVWFDKKDFEKKILSFTGGKKIKKWRVVKNRKSGRIKELKVYTDNGEKIIKGSSLRNLLGLKSTWIDIHKKGKKILIKGHGYGHGVGMCQWGAFGMAEKGYNYKRILKHYYKKTRLVKLW